MAAPQNWSEPEFKCWPSEANFILCRFGEDRRPSWSSCEARSISLRDRPDCEGCVRITIGTQPEMERLSLS